jgi:hypothetical protein
MPRGLMAAGALPERAATGFSKLVIRLQETAMSPSPVRHAMRCATVVTAVLLSSCGGNSDSDTPQNSVGPETAQSVSANTMVLSEDAAHANAVVLSAAEEVVAGGQASQTISCAGGGSAVFIVTGGSLAGMTNGQFDAGETYSLQFNACRSATDSASVDGLMTLAVTAASADAVSVNTSTQNIVVALPQRSLTLNGSSTLSRTVVTSGATVVTTHRWVSPQITLTSRHDARTNSLTFSNVDISRSVTTTNGVQTGHSSSGSMTLSLHVPSGAWTATISTQGLVSYDISGLPLQGAWQITLPHNRIGLSVAAGTATVTVDHGPDGSIDHTYVFDTTALAAEAV